MVNRLSLKGKTALITGSSRGLGAEIALQCAEAGANVIVTYYEKVDAAESMVEKIKKTGVRAISLQLDVSLRHSIRQIIRKSLDEFGGIDLLFNNAGILQQKPFDKITDSDWDRMLDVNLKGAFLCAQEIFNIMKKQGGGIIINIASTGGQLGGTLAVHYAASKAGVISLTKSLARLGAPHGIQVNCISPGLLDSEMTKAEINSVAGREKIKQILLKRPGTVEEVAHLAVFLASGQSSYITGQTINVDGGLYLR